ncbi:MAG: FHA domain-containing protein [Stagnimonas sp.]|nr:FHA domain-containing protein [Stagnimonas sp.]
MKPAAATDARVNVVLLAHAAPVRGGGPLGNEHQAKLKAALERPSAAIAVTGGGEFLGMYDRMEHALDAALAFLRLAEELQADGRIGNYCGRAVLEVWPESSEQLPVDRVREILSHARDHSLLLTHDAILHLQPAVRSELLPFELHEGESAALKGVMELPWRDGASTYREKTVHVSSVRDSGRHLALRLTRRGSSQTVRPEDCPYTIGRDSACALIIGGPNVSRLHGAILYDAGRFHLRDDSRNGSYLTTAGNEVFLRADRFPLLSDGVISPGATLVEQTGDVILYRCLTEDPGD